MAPGPVRTSWSAACRADSIVRSGSGDAPHSQELVGVAFRSLPVLQRAAIQAVLALRKLAARLSPAEIG